MDSTYQDPTPGIKKGGFFTASLPPGVKSLAKKTAKNKDIFTMKTLSEQIFAMMGPGQKITKYLRYNFELKHIGYMFNGLDKRYIKKLWNQGKKRSEHLFTGIGRPSALNPDQHLEVVQNIYACENARTPLTPSDLLEWVNERYNLELQQSWPFGFVKQHAKQLCITDAVPMEEERAKLTKIELEYYGADLEIAILCYDFRLIFNWDESGVEGTKNTIKSVIVSKRNEKKKIYYKTSRPPGHITILPIIGLSNERIPPLLILSQKTIDDDLAQFGFPNCDIGKIVITSSGFITEDALCSYITEVVDPHFRKIRKKLDLETYRCLLLQDSMSAHIKPRVKQLLMDAMIDTFEIPPHSSHLTQPLDQGTFAAFKKEMKKPYHTTHELTPRSIKIMQIFRSIERCTGFIQNLAAFSHSGFVLDMKSEFPLTFDIDKILSKDRVPQNIIVAIKAPTVKMKTKRKTLPHFESQKEKNTKIKRKDREEEKKTNKRMKGDQYNFTGIS